MYIYINTHMCTYVYTHTWISMRCSDPCCSDMFPTVSQPISHWENAAAVSPMTYWFFWHCGNGAMALSCHVPVAPPGCCAAKLLCHKYQRQAQSISEITGTIGSVVSSESKHFWLLATQLKCKSVMAVTFHGTSRVLSFILCCCTHLHLLELGLLGKGNSSWKRYMRRNIYRSSNGILKLEMIDWKLHASKKYIESNRTCSTLDFENEECPWESDSNLSAPPTILKLWKLGFETHRCETRMGNWW